MEAYLARVGWTGSLDPTLDTITGLLRAHMAAIPFENLDLLLGRGVRVDLDHVHAKLVAGRRGGYCFEHGTLFQAALAGLGVQVAAHAARVLLITPKAEAPRTHMFLTAHLEGETWVLDPGFGGHGPLVPVPLVAGREARSGTDVHRLAQLDGEWVLEGRLGGAMTALWTSTLEPQLPIDFELANHYVSTHPESRFVKHLLIRALTPDGRVSALNRAVSVLRGDTIEKRQLADRSELRTLLQAHFGFDLPDAQTLRVPSVPEWS
jgi:N-hydroxyarylamine O-acetyltransferase